MEQIILILKTINKMKKSEILLYAAVGISIFTFWYICFSFILNSKNAMNWEVESRLGLIITSVVTTLLYALTRAMKTL